MVVDLALFALVINLRSFLRKIAALPNRLSQSKLFILASSTFVLRPVSIERLFLKNIKT